MNNIRMLISFSISFLASIFYFDFIRNSLLFFGVWIVISFLMMFAVLAITPKGKREEYSKKSWFILSFVFVGLILTAILFLGKFDEFVSSISPIFSFFANK